MEAKIRPTSAAAAAPVNIKYRASRRLPRTSINKKAERVMPWWLVIAIPVLMVFAFPALIVYADDPIYPAVSLQAIPVSIAGDGLSITTLSATVTTSDTNPAPDGTPVVFTTTLGHLTGWSQVYTTTTNGGVATATLTSAPTTDDVTATVRAAASFASGVEEVALLGVACSRNFVTWAEYADNSVFGPAQKVYYPTVIYDADAFGHDRGDVISASLPYTYVVAPHFKMWTARSNANQGLQFAYSEDGLAWHQFYSGTQLSGLATQGYHSQVLYDAGGFGGSGYYYKIWYWDPSVSIYSITAMRTAESADGLVWANDQTLTQSITMPLVTGASPDWNRGTYGPVDLLYNPSATNSGTTPFDYSFVMYYDGTTGAFERVGLGYSADGVFWTRYGDEPVLDSGSDTWGDPTPWDSSYVGAGTVLRDTGGVYHFWYSGGTTAMNHGIGYATSSDGIHWVKSLDNPIFHVNDGVSWRDARTYTPIVFYSATRFDGHGSPEQYKMWFTGDDGSNRTIGYATLGPVSLSLSDTSGSGQVGTVGSGLDQPFVVGLRDACGEPVSGVTVTFAISSAPAGATGQSLSLSTGATGGTGQVSTTLTLGNEPGVYTMTAQSAGVTGMPAVFTVTATPGPVHHFSFAAIGDQVETHPFTIIITAEDAFSNTATAYTAPVTLTDSTGTISPTLSASFAGGVLAQEIVITADQTGVVITASHTATPTVSGVSNLFDVQLVWVQNLDTSEWFVTIQEAVDDPDTSNGHTILATVNTYAENVTISKGITLTGVSSATTIIDGSDVYNAVTIITGNVTLMNLGVRGGYQCDANPFSACGGVVIDSGDNSTLLTGIRLAHNTVVGNTGNGVFVTRADGLLIEDNLIHDNGGGGNRAGISLIGGAWGSPDVLVRNTTIRGNDIYSNTSYGVYMAYGVQDNVVEENRIHDNSKYGVQIIRFTATEPLRGNVIRGNRILDNRRNGIKLPNAAGTQVLTNRIANNGWGSTQAKYQYGVIIEGFGVGSATGNLLSGNQFVNNSGGGLILLGSQPVTHTTVQYNTFVTSRVAISNNVAYSVTAVFNDWGVTDLAAIEDKIYHQADDPGRGEVLYYGITLEGDGNNPMADRASYAVVTATLTGLLHPTGNIISFTTDLGTLSRLTGTADSNGVATTIITSADGGMATITGTAGMAGDNPRSDTTQVNFAPLALDHFHVYLIQDQMAGVSFPVAVSAQDGSDLTLTGFNGWATLADTTATLVPMPTTLIQFHNGVWNGMVTVTQAYAGDVIVATYLYDASKKGGSNTFDVKHNVAVDIVLAPAIAAITAGQPVTYTVWATDACGNSWDATAEASYNIDAGAGGSWADNVYTTQCAGDWAVTASLDGALDTGSLIVTHGPAASVALSPPSYTVTSGDVVTYTATASDEYGNSWDVTAAATYVIPPGTGGSWKANVYASQFVGAWVVTATLGGLSDAATLYVINATVAEIRLAPATAAIMAGQPVTYTVTATDTLGNSWDATAGTYLFVDSGAKGSWVGNTYTSQVAGAWAVTAVYGGQSDTVSLTVSHATATALELSPQTHIITAGSPAVYTVEATDILGNSWDASSEAVYDVEPDAGGYWTDNVYAGQSAGTWTVTTTLGSVNDTATLTITSLAVSLAVTPDPGSITVGQVITYTALANDGQGYSWDVTADTAFTIQVEAGGSWAGNAYTSAEIGDWTMTAEYEGLTDTANLTVHPFTIFLPMAQRNY
ncbi:MAG: right-handed parallel beta-helix repeat-containing protein [Chloroflexota bacterium]|nr:right-handed parallel beta-helix repeat-containing protein [Chloroflexota bacterium]